MGIYKAMNISFTIRKNKREH